MERKAITVSALNRYLKYRFDNDQNLKNIWLQAEISNFKRHSRGHLYLSLKDETSQINAVMFSQYTQKLTFEPKDGAKVMVEGYVSIYEPMGTYQVYITDMKEKGVGDLYQAFEALKQKLLAQGWFDAQHKKPIPTYPRTIGVITSPTGAAVRDIIHILNRRYPLANVLVYPALVQGEEAKFSIVKAIEKANRDRIADVLIVGRGGGSIEDLWAFNEEIVAKAVYESTLPIISAVGHETDTTIIDFVSDLRAPTPSGAAELAVPDQTTLVTSLLSHQEMLHRIMNRHLDLCRKELRQIESSYVFQNPARLTEQAQLQLMHVTERLNQARPDNRLKQGFEKLQTLRSRLDYVTQQQLKQSISTFLNLSEKLNILNPLVMMGKGFSLVKKDSVIIKSVEQLSLHDAITVTFQDGTVEADVTKLNKDVLPWKQN